MLKSFKYERHLFQRAYEVLKGMTELLVRLAEAAQASHRSKGLARSAISSKVLDPFAGPQLHV
jgi:hypothetical protein